MESCNLSKEEDSLRKKTSTELLLGIYLTKLNEEEKEEEVEEELGVDSSRLGQREEAPHPSLSHSHSLSLTLALSLTLSPRTPTSCCRGRVGA